MKKAYKYRFYPTPEQETLLRQTVGCCRFVYNRALALRSEAWTQRQERVSGNDLIKMLPLWKREEETVWLNDVPSVALQQTVCDLEVAFQNFFAKRTKHPQFKKKSSGGSCRFTASGFRIKNGEVWLAKTDQPLPVVWSRPLPENVKPTQCTVKLSSSGRWTISFLCDVAIEKLSPSPTSVGVDMGLTSLVTLSTGEKITNPKTFKTHYQHLARVQRHLSRKVKGSNNFRKTKLKLARIHEKISDTRKDQLHKISTRLVRENQTIAIEDLAVRNMLKNHNLAVSISDAAWSMFKSMLEYKCDWYGRELAVVDRWFPSSKTCHKCGHIEPKLPLNVREWSCPKCGTHHDRDVNAAINILSAGTVDYTCGGGVRPRQTTSVDASPVEAGIPAL